MHTVAYPRVARAASGDEFSGRHGRRESVMPDDMDERDDEDSEANLVLALAVEPEDLSLEELFSVTDEQVVEVVVRTLARVHVEEPVEISVLVTNDENLRTLNREYRDLDNSTDVLSFPAQDEPLVSAPADEL